LSSRLAKAIQRIIACAICVLIIYIGGLAVPSIGSMLGLNSSGVLNRDYRQDLFSRGMEEAYKHPLIGQSVPDVMASLIDLKQGEGIIDFVNTYLFILLTTGFIGLVAFVTAIFTSIIHLIMNNKFFKVYKIDLLSSTSAIIFSISMMIIFTSLVGRTTSGLSMFIAIGGYLCSIKPNPTFIDGKNLRASRTKMTLNSKLYGKRKSGILS
jgi:O-antigen ligase